MRVEVNIMTGGEAGQGVQSVGFLLSKILARGGFHVFADQDYESRVRGGHNFFRVRASDTEVYAISETLDILVALNRESIDLHQGEIKDAGRVIYDGEKIQGVQPDGRFVSVPLERLAEQQAGNKIMSNTVALGAALGLAKYDFALIASVLQEYFKSSAGDIAARNVVAAKAGFDHVQQHAGTADFLQLKPIERPGKMLLDGNEAIALGAIAAGLKFMASYPMTPTTSIMEYIADKGRQFNIVVLQPEDEIAAVNMVVGAAYAGARSMAATSGGGFCLMVEGLSLAGMTETPIVIVLGQRPGPAIGLPTRTEQGELLFAINAGHGEFPRVVLAPATVADCFYLTAKAFNLAEEFQTPVIVLTDQYLATSYSTSSRFDLSQVKINRGTLLSPEESDRQAAEYKRYRFTDSGISPRSLPLQGKPLVVTDSDEHDEEGHIIEDASTRSQMMTKRLRKRDGLRARIGEPRFHRVPGAEMTLVGWGSTYGAIVEAASLLKEEGLACNILHLTELWPFPAIAVSSALSSAPKTIVIENNATGQLERLLRSETGIKANGSINKFDGRPFSPMHIVTQLKREVA